jgi:hypothetical protein
LQLPPQIVPSVEHACREPWGAPTIGRHVPSLPDTSHASHWPAQACVQQKPSTQMPDRHSAGVLQVEPFSFLLEQTPPAQYSSWLQPASDVHEFGVPPHSVPSMHADPGGHAFSVWGGQLPAPSQKAARMALPLTHWASRQETPGPG